MRVLLFAALSILILTPARAFSDKIVADFTEVEFGTLKLAPEKYNNKKIFYTDTYQRYSATFPNYMERSGLRTDKNLLLEIGDIRIPAIVKKTDTMIEFIGGLKQRSTVKVYGKLRKFRANPGPDAGMAPEYYVEVEKIELVAEPDPAKEAQMQDMNKRPNEDWKNRQRPPNQRPPHRF